MAIIYVRGTYFDPLMTTAGRLDTVGDAGVPSILVDLPMCLLDDMSVSIDINGQKAVHG